MDGVKYSSIIETEELGKNESTTIVSIWTQKQVTYIVT